MKRELLLLALASCGSFGSADDASGADGGTTDAASTDAPNPSDAPVGTDASAGDAGRFCDSFLPLPGEEKLYCRDFDDGKPANQSWNGINDTDAGSISLDPAMFTSPPFSFRARVAAQSPGCTYARGIVDIGMIPATTRVAFDVLIGGDGTDPAEGASFFSISVGTCNLIFSASPEKGSVRAQTPGEDVPYDMVQHYPLAGAWTHVEAVLHRDANELEVFVGGQPALAGGKASLAAACLTEGSTVRLVVGMHCETTGTSPREVHVDDVVATGTTP